MLLLIPTETIASENFITRGSILVAFQSKQSQGILFCLFAVSTVSSLKLFSHAMTMPSYRGKLRASRPGVVMSGRSEPYSVLVCESLSSTHGASASWDGQRNFLGGQTTG
ncbi:hypothetical protein RRG08_033643 [Elysia crispata]|uniref:Uncharacterized protein n=1 Tax=Elysia crispata TaxID=231223 RepID=A0AAE0XQW6_9GAST|nr:hypothetical protein RRG08_033643 [Elysia crispata]